MKKSTLILTIILFYLTCISHDAMEEFSSFNQAKQYPIIHEGPIPVLFEEVLIVQGGIGAVICTMPDAKVLIFRQNEVLAILISEDCKDQIGNFDAVFNRVELIDPGLKNLGDDPWIAKNMRIARSNCAKPYPVPLPCGNLVQDFVRTHDLILES